MVNGVANCETPTGIMCNGTECRQYTTTTQGAYNAVSTSTTTNGDGTQTVTQYEYNSTTGATRTTETIKDAQGNVVGLPTTTTSTGLTNPASPDGTGAATGVPSGPDVPQGTLPTSSVDLTQTGFTEQSYLSFGSATCPAPRSFTVRGQSTSFSFDRICEGLAMFGLLLVALGAFIGVTIFLKMFPNVALG